MMNLHGMEDENALVEQREMIFLFQDSTNFATFNTTRN